MIEFYVGFFKPYLRDAEGKLTIRGVFGHCEIWGYTEDGTWFFMDPQSMGTLIHIEHRHDDVQRHLAFRYDLCDTILRIPAGAPDFRIPIFGLMTCAAICGHLTGVRALLPATLKRRLLAKGAEVVHGQAAEGRSGRQEGEAP